MFEATEDQPISAMEEAALEPLPELDAFASAWAELLRGALTKPRLRGSWALERQLREATLRSAGDAGLAELARAAVASVLEPREPLGWSGGDHGGQDAIDAAVWALTRGAPSTMIAQLARPRRHAIPGLDDPGAWIEEDLAREGGLTELCAPTLTELLGELGPSAPTPSEAKALRDAISRAALSRVSAVASSGRRSRYDDAARGVALASVLQADAGDGKAASDIVVRARAIAGRKWTLTQAIDRALGAPSKRAR